MAGGLLVMALTLALAPPPDEFSGRVIDDGVTRGWYGARGPAIADYDAANDTTVALFQCSHWYCGHAILLAGDQRDRVEARTVLLRASGGPFEPRALDEPIVTPEPLDDVDTYLSGEWGLVPRWPILGALFVGAASIIGGLWLMTQPRTLLRGVPVGAGLALLFAIPLATTLNWMVFAFVLFGLPVIVAALAVLSLLAWRWPRWRAAPLGLLAFVLALVGLVTLFGAWFPTAPEL